MLEDKRVLQVSFDVIAPEECDGCELADRIAEEIDKLYDVAVAGADFKADVTEIYRDSWL